MTAFEARVVAALARGPLTASELVMETEIPRGTMGNLLLNLRASGTVKINRFRYRGIGNGSGKAVHVYALSQWQRIGSSQ